MKINLLDPGLGLTHVRGHHLDWDARIANCLVALGHDVTVYAHVQATPAELPGFESAARVEPLFAMNPYRPPSDFDPICGDIQRQLVGARTICRDLSKVRRADLWLWPTAFAHQLRGCAATDTDAQISACLLLPPDSGFRYPGGETGPWWRMAVKDLHAAGRRILTLGTVEPEGLTALQQLIGDFDPLHLPMPVDGTPSRRTELRTIGILGAQRDEQGRHVVGGLIDCCLQAGFEVLTQTDKMVAAASKHHTGLTSLGYDGDFPSKVERCDLVVGPYRWNSYVGGRGSGVIWQAIASGVPCVAPNGSSPGRALARIGSGSLFSELSVASVFDAVLHAQQAYSALAEAAFRGAQDWREQNGVAGFVDVMINGGRNANIAH